MFNIMRPIILFNILIGYYFFIVINNVVGNLPKKNSYYNIPNYKVKNVSNIKNNKYNYFIIDTYNNMKRKNNSIYEHNFNNFNRKNKTYLFIDNKKRRRKFFYSKIEENKNLQGKELKPSRTVEKHIKTKYNLGNAHYRIQKELNNFLKNPPINCTIDVHPSNIRIWIVQYVGLENTIYANEVYKIKIIFPDNYPLKPPIVYFLQKPPKHTHVYSNGDICLSVLGDDYNPSLSISGLILSIISMLSSAKEKKLPIDNYTHADAKPGSSQNNFLYHDDKC